MYVNLSRPGFSGLQDMPDDGDEWIGYDRMVEIVREHNDIEARREQEPNWFLDVYDELRRARAKFPGTDLLTTAFAEEAGELVKAILDGYNGKPGDVYTEAIQTIAMVVRLLEEGDPIHRLKPIAPFSALVKAADVADDRIEAPTSFEESLEKAYWEYDATRKDPARSDRDWFKRAIRMHIGGTLGYRLACMLEMPEPTEEEVFQRVQALQSWKKQALSVLNGINLQGIAATIGVQIGQDIGPQVLPWIKAAKAKLEAIVYGNIPESEANQWALHESGAAFWIEPGDPGPEGMSWTFACAASILKTRQEEKQASPSPIEKRLCKLEAVAERLRPGLLQRLEDESAAGKATMDIVKHPDGTSTVVGESFIPSVGPVPDYTGEGSAWVPPPAQTAKEWQPGDGFPKVVAWPTEEHGCLYDPPSLPGSSLSLAAKVQEIQAGAVSSADRFASCSKNEPCTPSGCEAGQCNWPRCPTEAGAVKAPPTDFTSQAYTSIETAKLRELEASCQIFYESQQRALAERNKWQETAEKAANFLEEYASRVPGISAVIEALRNPTPNETSES